MLNYTKKKIIFIAVRGKDLSTHLGLNKAPSGWKNILWYIFVLPHTHLQYISIPSPLSKRNSNYYPLTIFCGVIWIALYCFIIVWFTYDLTKAFNKNEILSYF